MTARPLLFHVSDIHFGLENNRALDWVAAEIATRQPDAVVITGHGPNTSIGQEKASNGFVRG